MLLRFRDCVSSLRILQIGLDHELTTQLNLTWFRRTATSPLQQLPTQTLQPKTSNKLCRANYRQLQISTKKLTPVARLVRKMRVQDALYQCDLLQRKGALIVQNALRSARANGVHNQGLDGSNLVIEECFATNGRGLKRVKIHGRGRAGIVHRRRTHLTVILREDSEMKLRPHVVQPTWMQRELDRASDSKRRIPRKDSSKDGVVKTPRMKWRKMLRLQRVRKQAERKAARLGRIRKPTKDVTPQLTDYLKNKM